MVIVATVKEFAGRSLGVEKSGKLCLLFYLT